MAAVAASKPRGKLRIPMVFSTKIPSLATGTHFLWGTTTDAAVVALGFPFRVVSVHACCPVMTDTTTVAVTVYKNTDTTTGDVILNIPAASLTGASAADKVASATTVSDAPSGAAGLDVLKATDALLVKLTVGVTALLTGITVIVVIEPMEA